MATVAMKTRVGTVRSSVHQVTIPKKIRESVGLSPGNMVEFEVEPDGRILLRKTGTGHVTGTPAETARFERVRGKATIKWRTDDLMALLRDE